MTKQFWNSPWVRRPLFGFGILLMIVQLWALIDLNSQSPRTALATQSEYINLTGKFECGYFKDDQGVSHVKARNEFEGFACLGYLHGFERGVQVDYLKRIALGRRSEILGFQSIKEDFLLRTLELEKRALALFQSSDEVMKRKLTAYGYGMNVGLSASDGHEWRKLGVKPLAWRPHDVFLLALLQSFDQTKKSFETEFLQEKQIELYGDSAPVAYSDEQTPWDTTVLKVGEYPMAADAKVKKKASLSAQIWIPQIAERSSAVGLATSSLNDWAVLEKNVRDYGLVADEQTGSNNWVLAGSRTQTKRAMVANDPHLGLKHPPFWHWVNVQVAPSGDLPGYDAIGATLPGVPAIVSGANRNVAWGLTNAYLDVADVYELPLTSELVENSEKHWPRLWIKFGMFRFPMQFKSFQTTRPVTGTIARLPILPIRSAKGNALLLKWSAFDLEAKDFSGLLDLIKVNSAVAADELFQHLQVPTWNFVFADTGGNIGYRAVGKIPKRLAIDRVGFGGFTKDENKAKKMIEYLSPSEMPHVLNPDRGYVATANNRQWPKDSAFFGGFANSPSLRAFEIESLLTASAGMSRQKGHTVESVSQIQCDSTAVESRFLIPKILGLFKLDLSDAKPAQLPFLKLLSLWDLKMSKECLICGFYRALVNDLKFAGSLNDSSLFRALGALSSQSGEKSKPALAVDKSAVENSIDHAMAYLRVSKVEDLKPWGEIHRARFRSLIDSDRLAEDKSLATVGDDNSINPGSSKQVNHEFDHTDGASHRLIVDMSSPPVVYAQLAGPNADLDSRDFESQSSAWRAWSECRLEKRVFPAADSDYKERIVLK